MRDVVGTLDRPVETHGLTEVADFTIKADAKAFDILINGLYSDKIRAIIRETWSNAYDSHCAAGIPDRPFFSHLPERFDATYSVRDFGVSLTHEQVMHLYTSVFTSTKEDTNSQVGKFGLGSKTPFAYVDSFSVTAILDGEKRVYNAFKDERRIPRIALFVREPTDEENGLEISFAVKQQDIGAFNSAAHRVALGFDVVPDNNLGIQKVELDVAFEGNGWKVVKPDWRSGLQGALVRQGCVLYPVDKNALDAVKQSEAVASLTEETIIIDMPIGTVDITPSRESLSYDPITAKNLIVKFEEIAGQYLTQAIDKIQTSKTWFEAVSNRNAVLASITSKSMREFVKKRLSWRGRQVTEKVHVDAAVFKSLRRRGYDVSAVYAERKGRRNSAARYTTRGVDVSQMFHTTNLPVFIYSTGSSPKHLGHRLESAAKAHPHSDLYYISSFRPDSFGAKVIYTALGRPEDHTLFVNIEDFTYVKPDYQKTLASLNVWTGHKFDIPTRKVTEDQENVFYVHTFKGEAKRDDKEVGNRRVAKLWDALLSTKLIPHDAVLVGIPASRKDIARNIPDAWEDFFSYATNVVTEKFDAKTAARAQAALNIKSDSSDAGQITNFLISLLPHVSLVNAPDSIASTAITTIKNYGDAVPEDDLHLALKELIGELVPADEAAVLLADFDVTPHTEEFWRLVNNFNRAYPMLCVMLEQARRIYYSRNIDLDDSQVIEAFDYINMKDAQASDARENDLAWAA
jgi:hypothetical protein